MSCTKNFTKTSSKAKNVIVCQKIDKTSKDQFSTYTEVKQMSPSQC